jgi:hypothetical protein
MTDQELKDLVASLAADTQALKLQMAASQAETDRQIRELGKQIGGLGNKFGTFTEGISLPLAASQAETGRQIRELGKQIGGLGNKFGTFTEGISLPSVARLMFERFGVEDFMPSRRRRTGGDTIELDALATVNGERNAAYLVEIKSHLRMDTLDQVFSMMNRFRNAFPEYASMKLYGILVAASTSPDALEAARKAGLYVIAFDDDIMRFYDEDGFVPVAY